MDQQVKDAAPTAAQGIPMPAIGQPLADGIFAGIARGDDGDVALVDLGFITDGGANWKRAGEIAATKSATLPTREEARLLWANLDSRSKESRGWFWASTHYAGFDDYAWIQHFGNGNQFYVRKGTECTVRAVRRLPLQSFSDSQVTK